MRDVFHEPFQKHLSKNLSEIDWSCGSRYVLLRWINDQMAVLAQSRRHKTLKSSEKKIIQNSSRPLSPRHSVCWKVCGQHPVVVEIFYFERSISIDRDNRKFLWLMELVMWKVHIWTDTIGNLEVQPNECTQDVFWKKKSSHLEKHQEEHKVN